MENDYKIAIEILSNNCHDWREICFKIAKENPTVFISVFDTDESKKNQIDEELIHYAEDNGGYSYVKIALIKKCRELTNMNLGEAKRYVEKLFE
jgi:ribosomal protein L7/L12